MAAFSIGQLVNETYDNTKNGNIKLTDAIVAKVESDLAEMDGNSLSSEEEAGLGLGLGLQTTISNNNSNQAHVFVILTAVACVCCIFCYLGFYCSHTHFAANQYHRPAELSTQNCTMDALEVSICVLTDAVGSITNLKDEDDDARDFAQWKRVHERAMNGLSPTKSPVTTSNNDVVDPPTPFPEMCTTTTSLHSGLICATTTTTETSL
jgi:hypothetical protein